MKTSRLVLSAISLMFILFVAGSANLYAGENDFLFNLPDSIKKKSSMDRLWFKNGSVKLGAGSNGHVFAFEVAAYNDLLLEAGMSSWMFIGRAYGQVKYRVYKNFNHGLRIGIEGAEMYEMSVIKGGRGNTFDFLPMAIAEFEFFDFSISAGYSPMKTDISFPGYIAFNYFVVLNPEVHRMNKTKYNSGE